MGKHIPIRECSCCRKKDEKQNYCRIVKTKEGFFVDSTHKKEGRGAYICPACLNDPALLKKRPLDRAFRQKVPEGVYAALADAREGKA
ncbi:MAG TPA: DUF448 domain-containing protein [Clostridiales bacterium]|nr:YlxR family protein [Clostridiales bacterium]HBL82887.1 DUF448 domain-containing protein [Clostridiales bacterium]